MADSINYTAPCPQCGAASTWSATVRPTVVGGARVQIGYLIKCSQCDKGRQRP